MTEILFKLFGETAKRVEILLKEGKTFNYIVDSVEGRLIIKVYVDNDSGYICVDCLTTIYENELTFLEDKQPIHKECLKP
ncbi:MAG: hypothetical protein AABY22_01655 [Nanoarchaeota archaeon]